MVTTPKMATTTLTWQVSIGTQARAALRLELPAAQLKHKLLAPQVLKALSSLLGCHLGRTGTVTPLGPPQGDGVLRSGDSGEEAS